MTSKSSLSHTFHAFRHRFWGFSKILEFLSFLWNFWVGFCEIVDIWSCIAFSLHYNNVSCILDVCAWLLFWVLIGLDWVLPMILLFLHVTCSCIFHAYVLSFLSYSELMSLSQIDCVMAPKQRKSTLTRNPLCGFESSFYDPLVPFHIRFCDEKAKTDFFKNFQNRGVHPKCQVILSDFSDTALPEVIRTQGWESHYGKPERCPVMFI